ncbi:MAG: hypothetical protein KAH32_01540 [Chlamydiia bacterium]|nr:hypothetical protein [Chlamydiia bacterium]
MPDVASPNLISAFSAYNDQLGVDEKNLTGDLDKLASSGKKPSLSAMMNYTYKINNVMAKSTLMMTQTANYFKMINNIAQRAIVS